MKQKNKTTYVALLELCEVRASAMALEESIEISLRDTEWVK